MNDRISSASTTRFPIVSYEEASPEVRAVYDDAMRTLQLPFVLNWFKCQGGNATLLRGNWAKLKSTLLEGEVPNVLKQLIIYNVSKQRGCEYCARAHAIFADSMSSMISTAPGFRATNLESPEIPESFKVAVRLTTKAAMYPQDFSNQDYAALLDVGFTTDETQELLAQADLVNMLNTIADLSGIRIDNELVEIEQ
ncbi:MAG: carboxymuconolactone decarboxylase family protein [Verrucomicrobiota bacterium JB022]|nr:carboxymuconolactone decarboxylase family protein [Verrucomicrobiota bacterium JB022]